MHFEPKYTRHVGRRARLRHQLGESLQVEVGESRAKECAVDVVAVGYVVFVELLYHKGERDVRLGPRMAYTETALERTELLPGSSAQCRTLPMPTKGGRGKRTWHLGQKSFMGLLPLWETKSLKPTGSTVCFSQSVRGHEPNSCALNFTFCARTMGGEESDARRTAAAKGARRG